jgi:hypothetical protein
VRVVLASVDSGPWRPARPAGDTLFEWVLEIDTWELDNGPHRLSVVCADDVQLSEVVEVSFAVDNDWRYPYGRPRCTVLSPANGTLVGGVVTLEGNASDDALVEEVLVRIGDGPPLPAAGTDEWELSIDTLAYPNGPLALQVWATDGERDSPVVGWTLEVWNDRPPTCTITWPLDNMSVVEDVVVTGEAQDPEGVDPVVWLRIDSGDWIRCTGAGVWEYRWNVSSVGEGRHVLRARSFDGTSYSEEAMVEVTAYDLSEPTSQPTDRASENLERAVLVVLAVAVAILLIYVLVLRRPD